MRALVCCSQGRPGVLSTLAARLTSTANVCSTHLRMVAERRRRAGRGGWGRARGWSRKRLVAMDQRYCEGHARGLGGPASGQRKSGELTNRRRNCEKRRQCMVYRLARRAACRGSSPIATVGTGSQFLIFLLTTSQSRFCKPDAAIPGKLNRAIEQSSDRLTLTSAHPALAHRHPPGLASTKSLRS